MRRGLKSLYCVGLKTAIVALMFVSASSLASNEELSLKTSLGPLVGTLELPEQVPLKAVVLIVAGSGPIDRDGNSAALPGKNNSLKYLAEALKAQGIASLRFDKRLVGASMTDQLDERSLRLETYVRDVQTWFSYLDKRFAQPIFVLGHSEGALISALAIIDLPADGLIYLAGPARPAGELILEQVEGRLSATLMNEVRVIVNKLNQGQTTESISPALVPLLRYSVQPYLISWFQYDPRKEIRKLNTPVLLAYGSTDIQVPMTAGADLKQVLPKAEFVVINGMNHVLKQASGDIKQQLPSYSDSNLPIVGGLVSTVVKFVENIADKSIPQRTHTKASL